MSEQNQSNSYIPVWQTSVCAILLRWTSWERYLEREPRKEGGCVSLQAIVFEDANRKFALNYANDFCKLNDCKRISASYSQRPIWVEISAGQLMQEIRGLWSVTINYLHKNK